MNPELTPTYYNRKTIIVVLSLGLLCFAAYGTSIHNGFLMDDAKAVQQNILIRNLLSFPQYFHQPFMKGYYRPMTQFSFALDYLIWKLNPLGYHLTSIAIHFLNSVLLFILLQIIWERFALSSVVSFLFAVHPLGSIAVNYVADRSNLLGTLFMLSALIAFCVAWKGYDRRFYLVGFLFFICSLLSHESAILFPLYLFCTLSLLSKKSDTKKLIILTGFAIFISFGYYLLHILFFNFGTKIFPDIKLQEYFRNLPALFYLIFKYLLLAIWPVNICLIRSLAPMPTFSPLGIFYIFLGIVFISLVLIKFRKNRVILFSLAWFLIGVLPLYRMMFARPEMGLIMQDNWIYFASIGLLIIYGQCILFLRKFFKKWLILLLALLFFYINLDLFNNALWKNGETYCSYWLKVVPKNPLAFNGMGVFYTDRKNYKKAKEYFLKGVFCCRKINGLSVTNELIPGRLLGELLNNLAIVSDMEGNPDEARRYCELAIMSYNNNSDAYFFLGNLYLRKNDIDKAILYYKESVKKNYYRMDAHRQLALLYSLKGNKKEAIKEAMAAISLDPNCFNVFGNTQGVRNTKEK